MMALIFKIVIALIIPFGAGLSFVHLLFKGKQVSMPLSFALAYGFGTGFLSLWMVLLAFLGVNFQFSVIAFPLLTMTLLVTLFLIKRKAFDFHILERHAFFNEIKSDLISVALLIFICSYLAYIFWSALSIPVQVWDEIERVAFRAKVFSFDRTLNQLKYLPHPSYPILLELAITWIVINLNSWSDQIIKIITPMFFCLIRQYISYF